MAKNHVEFVNKNDFIKFLNEYISDVDFRQHGNVVDVTFPNWNGYQFTYTLVYQDGHRFDTRNYYSNCDKYFKFL